MRERRRTGSGGAVIKRCSGCQREVLSAHRGEVTPIGKGEIQSVTSKGDVIGKCHCGRRVVWEREVRRGPPSVTTG